MNNITKGFFRAKCFVIQYTNGAKRTSAIIKVLGIVKSG